MQTVVTLLCDSPNSWIWPWIRNFAEQLNRRGHHVFVAHSQDEIVAGDICAILACECILRPEFLKRNKHNLVVHESDLPKGKGWSPLTWQILEGKSRICVSLFEAVKGVDAGPIYGKRWMHFQGNELVDELRCMQAETTFSLLSDFIAEYPDVESRPQIGEASFYPRRNPDDSRLDPHKSLLEQFNLLRVVDNERYPAYFEHAGHRYTIKISKDGPAKDASA